MYNEYSESKFISFIFSRFDQLFFFPIEIQILGMYACHWAYETVKSWRWNFDIIAK